MLERKGSLESLWRSRELVSGGFLRVLAIGVVFTLIQLAFLLPALMVSAVLSFVSSILSTVFFAAVSALITPFLWIGRTLVYYDLRVRKEQYTIDQLAADLGLPPPSAEVNAE